jgi:hypothetical protein
MKISSTSGVDKWVSNSTTVSALVLASTNVDAVSPLNQCANNLQYDFGVI